MKSLLATKSLRFALSLLFLSIIVFFNYGVDRSNFYLLSSLYAAAFGIYLFLIFGFFKKLKNNTKWLIGLAILTRFSILFALPNLSDDFYRFLWDGMLTNNGISPFETLPSEIASHFSNSYTELLIGKMNSPNYFSVYPPIHQSFFAFANFLFPNNIYGGVVTLKAFIFLFEMITITTLYQIVSNLKLNKNIIPLYALNPLVIIEFCGNIHFESILIAFLLLTIYLLYLNKWKLASITYAGAILAKLHPLMLLLFFMKYLGFKRGILFATFALAITLTMFIPFLLPLNNSISYVENILNSLSLYFQTFEFNGGIYYIFRWIGTKIYGYNPIETVGKILLIINIIAIITIFLFQKKSLKSLITSITIALLFYVMLATTIHPWYILPLLPFSLLLKPKSILVWSGLIFLSYFAYSTNDWHENFYFIILEYTFVFIFLFNDIKQANFIHENYQ